MKVIKEKYNLEKKTLLINGFKLSIDDVVCVSRYKQHIELADEAKGKIIKAYNIVKSKIKEKNPIYGITTGFGKLSNVIIDQKESRQLQKNLIMSHACAVGNPFSEEVTRAIMLIRVNTLAKGYSGVHPRVIKSLLEMINKGVHPIIPEKGSLGASGDLANLAHMALVMIGLGKAFYKGRIFDGKVAMKEASIPIIQLEGKDGLGLINGTQAMTALGVMHVYEAWRLIKTANIAAALTFEALHGLTDALDSRIHRIRPHLGQIECASEILKLLEGSTYTNKTERVQDAYTLRCAPQVHGASLDAIKYVKNVLTTEMNAATDNPLIFPNEREIISGGNFHGQPIALALDFLAIALSELANISERRIERLVNPQLSNLPPFLSKLSGINCGYMIPQYTAASLVSENKIMASPASVDSIPSSANQEDHVSMGAISARKVGTIIDNLRNVLSIELMCAAQAIDIQSPNILGRGTEQAYLKIRERVPTLKSDRVLNIDINEINKLLREEQFLEI